MGEYDLKKGYGSCDVRQREKIDIIHALSQEQGRTKVLCDCVMCRAAATITSSSITAKGILSERRCGRKPWPYMPRAEAQQAPERSRVSYRIRAGVGRYKAKSLMREANIVSTQWRKHRYKIRTMSLKLPLIY